MGKNRIKLETGDGSRPIGLIKKILASAPTGLDRPMFGTTMLLGGMDVQTECALFRVHLFQNISQRTLLLVWSLGAINTEEALLVRTHSSCLTSEVLHASDCDCMEQLETAMRKVAAGGRGAIFYILQEGRGAGLVSKTRDRMLVQASGNKINTFDAYKELGLDPDLRIYSCIRDACKLLHIKAPFRLLTNNPEKAATLAAAGISIGSIESISIAPSHDNYTYLSAKKDAGHNLSITPFKEMPRPHEMSVKTITPRALQEANRFVLVAEYVLPLSMVRLGRLETAADIPEDPEDADGTLLAKKGSVCFDCAVYYDVVTWQHVVILSRNSELNNQSNPLIYVHRDFLLDRFPLVTSHSSGTFRTAVRAILKNGCGMIAVISSEGQDMLDLMHQARVNPQQGHSHSESSLIADFKFVVPVLRHKLSAAAKLRILIPSQFAPVQSKLEGVLRDDAGVSECQFLPI